MSLSPTALLQAGAAMAEPPLQQRFQRVLDAHTAALEGLRRIADTTNDPHSRELARAALKNAEG